MAKLDDFLVTRKMFYIDMDRGVVRFPDGRHSAMSSAEWLTDYNIPWANLIRGYFYESDGKKFVMLYTNNFEIPCCNVSILIYLFHHFKEIEWLGLGAIKGEPGDLWEPQLKIYNNYV